LIRDKEIIYPTEFFNASLVPPRLPQKLEPRISVWNIDGEIVTQGITLWKPEKVSEGDKTIKPKFSFLYVCSRYSNRLRASLLSIAHQRQFDLNQVEIVVAYVPDLDATDDVLDCFESAFPNIKIIRSPFSQSYWKSKGFLINASLPLCSADWVILIDADIVLHPNFLSTMDKIGPDIPFVAPDGRKMLTPETTSQILLGLIRPWEQYDTLMEGPGEWRRREADGIPIGYCQCCRKEVFQKIKYPDFNHFEGADWFFGRSVVQTFGPEHRLTGIPLLHLDHGGSQWYGSQKHR
jgi:glycosyltransferase involved in cell wall biosynthesis